MYVPSYHTMEYYRTNCCMYHMILHCCVESVSTKTDCCTRTKALAGSGPTGVAYSSTRHAAEQQSKDSQYFALSSSTRYTAVVQHNKDNSQYSVLLQCSQISLSGMIDGIALG